MREAHVTSEPRGAKIASVALFLVNYPFLTNLEHFYKADVKGSRTFHTISPFVPLFKRTLYDKLLIFQKQYYRRDSISFSQTLQ